MNKLVEILQDDPEKLLWLSQNRASGILLFERISALDGSIRSARRDAERAEQFRQEIELSYIPSCSLAQWERLRNAARSSRRISLPIDERLDWSHFFSNPETPEDGIIVPDDSDAEPYISVFTRRQKSHSVLRIALTSRGKSQVCKSHCSAPLDQGCSIGRCGQCKLRSIEAHGIEGLICWCPHA